MVEYLSGNRIQGSSTLTSSPSPTGWKLLKRSTAVGSGGTQTVDSGTFTAKDNLMILSHIINGNTGDGDNPQGAIKFNSSTGNEYGQTFSRGAESGNGNITQSTTNGSSAVAQIDIWNGLGSGTSAFTMTEIGNISNFKKMLNFSSCYDRNGTTASNVPCRSEGSGAYSPSSLSTNITSVQVTNVGDGDFDAGSEIVVLGVDNDDDGSSGTNFWEKLAWNGLSANNSGSPDYLCNELSFAKKKYLWIREHKLATGNTRSKYRFNGNSSNYARRMNDWGTSGSSSDDIDSTSASEAMLYGSGGGAEAISNTFVVNSDSYTKLCFTHIVEHNSDGANNTARVWQFWWKWVNNAQVENLTIFNDGTGNFGVGSEVTVWGAD